MIMRSDASFPVVSTIMGTSEGMVVDPKMWNEDVEVYEWSAGDELQQPPKFAHNKVQAKFWREQNLRGSQAKNPSEIRNLTQGVGARDVDGQSKQSPFEDDNAALIESCQLSRVKQTVSRSAFDYTEACRNQIFGQIQKIRHMLSHQSFEIGDAAGVDEADTPSLKDAENQGHFSSEQHSVRVGIDPQPTRFCGLPSPGDARGPPQSIDNHIAVSRTEKLIKVLRDSHQGAYTKHRTAFCQRCGDQEDGNEYSCQQHAHTLKDLRSPIRHPELEGAAAEMELDRLARQVQLLVHQLATCQQNLVKAEKEVGFLHEENREFRCLIRDLLATNSGGASKLHR